MGYSISDLCEDEGYQALVLDNDDRADVVRAMAADDYAVERLSGDGDSLLCYELAMRAFDAKRRAYGALGYGEWAECEATGIAARVVGPLHFWTRDDGTGSMLACHVRLLRRQSEYEWGFAGQARTVAEVAACLLERLVFWQKCAGTVGEVRI